MVNYFRLNLLLAFLLFMPGFALASGWHIAEEILPGTFSSGDFTFNGSVVLVSGNQFNASEICLNGDCQTAWSAASGDITDVNAGTGLSGGGTSGSVTLTANTSYLQRRVSSTCAVNQSIRVINSDGTVTCQNVSSSSETDPVFVASHAYNINSTNTSNWNTAYGWGDHSGQGYLTSETDGSTSNEIQNIIANQGLIRDGSNNFGLLNTCGDGEILKYNSTSTSWYCASDNGVGSESDPVYIASHAYNINSTNTSNWNTAYSWGDHSGQGYLTSESDTLDLVAGRGSTTSNSISVGGLNVANGTLYYNSSSGNIGIGTTAPGVALHIKNSSYGTVNTGFGFMPASSASSYNRMWGYEGKGLQIGGSANDDTNNDNLNEIFLNDTGMFFTTSVNNALQNRLTILNNGNIGIGTSTPSERLTLGNGTFKTIQNNPRFLGNYTSDAQLGTWSYQMKVVGKYAYVLGYGTDNFIVLDISDPENPVYLGNYSSSTNMDGPWYLDVAGKYAYVSGWAGDSLTIMDISDPTNPTYVGKYSSSTYLDRPAGVKVIGKYAYVVAYGNDALTVIDVSNPKNPKKAGFYSSSTYLDGGYGLDIEGDYAYLALDVGDSLAIVDISDPKNPSFSGNYTSSTYLNKSYNVDVEGKYAYVTSASGDYLTIIDVSDPSSPSFVSAYDTTQDGMTWPSAIEVLGDYAYISGWAPNPSNNFTFSILDISNPASPVNKGFYTTSTFNGSEGMSISGKTAYFSGSGGSFLTFDIGGIDSQAARIGSLETTKLSVTGNADIANYLNVRTGLNVGQGGIHSDGDVGLSGNLEVSQKELKFLGNYTDFTYLSELDNFYVKDDFAYLPGASGSNSLMILDVSDSENMVYVSSYTNATTMDYAYAVQVAGDYAYVATNDGLSILDVSDKSSPTYIGSYINNAYVGYGTQVYVSGEYAYVTSFYNDTLLVLDVSDPTSPSYVSNYTSTTNIDEALDLEVIGDYAYIVTGDPGAGNAVFTILDIGDVYNISLASKTEIASTNMNDLYISGKYAYIVSDKLNIYDITDPTSPVSVANYTSDFSSSCTTPYGVVVSGDFAYVGYGGVTCVEVVDIKDPANPVGISYYTQYFSDTAYSPYGVEIEGNTLYIGTWDSTLVTFEISGIEAPSAKIGSLKSSQFSTQEAKVYNSLDVGSDLTVGKGGIRSDGRVVLSNQLKIDVNYSNFDLFDGSAYYRSLINLKGTLEGNVDDGWRGLRGIQIDLTNYANGSSWSDVEGIDVIVRTDDDDSTGQEAYAYLARLKTHSGDYGYGLWIADQDTSTGGTTYGVRMNLNDADVTRYGIYQQNSGTINYFNGNTGIGTASPNDKLDVVGDIDATGCVQTDDTGSIGGTCVSDKRLKTNIEELDNSLEKISSLRPVSYTWRPEMKNISKEEGNGVGLIAQEVEQVFPELVKEGEDGYKRVKYDTQLTMHMIEAIKELKEENDALKAIICKNNPQETIC